MKVIQKTNRMRTRAKYGSFKFENISEFKRIGLLGKECRFLVETIATFESQVSSSVNSYILIFIRFITLFNFKRDFGFLLMYLCMAEVLHFI